MRTRGFIISFLTGLTLLAFADDPNRPQRLLECFQVEKPPVLDGRMDDPCWQEAPVADNFILHQSDNKPPTNKTEVRTCYDAENLYFFWTLQEKQMDKLNYGPPEDIRDNLDWNGDIAELFLSPGADINQYYQLAVSPQGARFDAFLRDTFFNAGWQVKSGIFADHWTIEMAIPFTAFLRHAEYMGTPSAGDVWGLQFCRDQGYLHEWSTWRNQELPSFLRPEGFASLKFAGSRNRPLPVSIKNNFTEIFFGSRQRFGFTLNQAKPGLRAAASLLHNGKKVAGNDIRVDSANFFFDFDILQGGTWEIQVEAYESDGKIYQGLARKELPPVVETFHTIAAEKIDDLLRNSDYPGKEAFIRELDAMQKECSEAVKMLQTPENLLTAQWQELVALYAKVNTEWAKISFVSYLVKLYQAMPQPRLAFAVGQAGPQEKIYPDSLYQGPLNAPLKISLAGRETESSQLVVIPFGCELNEVKVHFSDLKDSSGRLIKAENFRWFTIDYVKINVKPPTGESTFEPYEPDILLENRPLAIPRNTLRPLWLDFYLPAGTPQGIYAGTIEVRAGEQFLKLPLEITAWGFDIPEKTTLKNDFWLSPTLSWEKFYAGFGKEGYSPELHRKHAQVLSRYRVNPFVFHHAVYWHPANIKIYREKDGSFSFDFSKWEQYMDTGIESGGNFFPASMGCGTDSFNRFVFNHPVFDRNTGKETRLYQCLPELAKYKELLVKGDYVAALQNNRFYLDFMAAYLKLLQKKNLLAISGWEYFDEPSTNVRWEAMLKTHAFLKEKFPELQRFAYSVEPRVERALKKSLGQIDLWAPSLYVLKNESLLQNIKQRREKFGERFIFYTCTSRQDSQGNYTPFMYYYHSYLAPRMHAWMAYKYGAEGFMSFMLNSIAAENMPDKEKAKKVWPESEWIAGRWQGCGILIYPGPDGEAIPSMRLASFRDGLEDYEYLVMLRKLQAFLDPERHPDLYRRIDLELELENEIIQDVFVWTKDPGVIAAKRERIANLIVQARTVIEGEKLR